MYFGKLGKYNITNRNEMMLCDALVTLGSEISSHNNFGDNSFYLEVMKDFK